MKKIVVNKWYGMDVLHSLDFPSGLIDWLKDENSMTQKLESERGVSANFKLLSQDLGQPLLEEADYLGVSMRQSARIRHVAWMEQGQYWLLGRCMIPLPTLEVNSQCLLHWNDQPIGQALFLDPGLQRVRVQVSCLDDEHDLYHVIPGQTNYDVLWARRSVFYYYGAPLVVSELFFPPLVAYLSQL